MLFYCVSGWMLELTSNFPAGTGRCCCSAERLPILPSVTLSWQIPMALLRTCFPLAPQKGSLVPQPFTLNKESPETAAAQMVRTSRGEIPPGLCPWKRRRGTSRDPRPHAGPRHPRPASSGLSHPTRHPGSPTKAELLS